MLIAFLGCDSSNTIKPLGEAYFMKFYGTIGYQEGVSVKATPDGGFIIGGNSIPTFGEKSDFLLIKVDASGNQEWLYTYDFNGTQENDFLTDVVVDGSNYIIAGTSIINGDSKMVLWQIDQLGGKGISLVIDPTLPADLPQDINSYVLKGISKTLSGDYMLVGPVINEGAAQKGKSVIAIISPAFVVQKEEFYPVNPSISDELIFVRATELLNQSSQVNNYLVTGYYNTDTGSDIVLYQILSSSGAEINTVERKNVSDTKLVDAIKITDTNFKILTSSDDKSFLIDVFEQLNGPTAGNYKLGAEQQVIVPFFQGISLQPKQNGKFIISANLNEESSLKSSSTIVESSNSGIINWERFFGTDFSYTSGEAMITSDGGLVYTGTAGLKDQSKVFLIKMKDTGEME